MIQTRGKFRILFVIAFIFVLCSGSLFAQNSAWTGLLNSNSVNGVNGNICAITVFQNNIVVAGGFSQAGGVNARNLPACDGTTSSALGNGPGNTGDSIYPLPVFNHEPSAARQFNNPSQNLPRCTR